MKNLPQRVSLVTQTTTVLKDEIQSGRWTNQLPGEHELCAMLHVGRVTLRSALSQLQREGWVKTSRGRRREIVRRKRVTKRAVSDRVVFLTPVPLHNLQPQTIFLVDALREHLSEAGYHLEVHGHRDCYSGRPEKALEALALRLNAAGWVISQSTARMQQWFAKRAMPCVVTGSRHEGVSLPSLDRDYRALSRHAVGAFLARGHRRLALLNPTPVLAGDLVSEEGFKDGALKSPVSDAQVSIVRHNGTVGDICSKVDVLLKGAQPCTGFLVSRSNHVLTVMTHLMSRGLKFPKDVALISRDNDPFLASVTPSVARYALNPSLFARAISNLVVATVRGGATPSKDTLMMPEFLAGQTLG